MNGKDKSCPAKEAFQRMNYLFQLSNMCATGQIAHAKPVANLYAHQVIAISKKTVQRIEPGIKHRICKCCHQYLVPGETCKVRIRKKVVVHQCLLCNAEKRFNAVPDNELWIEKQEACAEVLDYREKE